MVTSPWWRTATGPRVYVAVAFAVALTGLPLAVPRIEFGYPLPGLAIVVASLTSASAFALAWMFALRHRREHRRRDLLVTVAFGITALLEGVLPTLAELAPWIADNAFYSRILGRSVVAVVLVAAAWLPERVWARAWPPRDLVLACLLGCVGIMGYIAFRMSSLPQVINGPGGATVFLHTSLGVVFRVGSTFGLLAAAAGFLRQRRSQGDLLGWLSIACVLLATARLHDYLYPLLRSDWLTSSATLRLVAQLLLLFGALHEIVVLWAQRLSEATVAERRRVAAELHDGLAQELAYISTLSALAAKEPTTGNLARLSESAERALREARTAISDFTAETSRGRLDLIVARLSREISERYGYPVVLDLDEVATDGRTAHELGQVAREAMNNAARHGKPSRIVVRLGSTSGRLQLSIIDDGAGVHAATARAEPGFGLTLMHDRVERLGGSCSVTSSSGRGTTVRIEVPTR